MKKQIFLIFFIILSCNLIAENIPQSYTSTDADTLNFFWNRYIKNAVYELNPGNGFNNQTEITINNVVRYCLNEYYRKKGFSKLPKKKSIVDTYKIHISDIVPIASEDLNVKLLALDILEEAVFDKKTQMLSFDPRMLSLYQNNNQYLGFPVLENMIVSSDQTYGFVVNFYRDSDKKDFYYQMTYFLKKRENSSYYFKKTEFSDLYHSEDYVKAGLHLKIQASPEFLEDCFYAGADQNNFYILLRDYYSGIFNYYTIDNKSCKCMKVERYFFGKKKLLKSVIFQKNLVKIYFENEEHSFQTKNLFNGEYIIDSEPFYTIEEESNKYSYLIDNYDLYDKNAYGEMFLYAERTAKIQESQVIPSTIVVGTWLKKPGQEEFEKITIKGLEEDPFIKFLDLALGKDCAYYISEEWSEDLKSKTYSINKIDLITKEQQTNILVYDSNLFKLFFAPDTKTLIVKQLEKNGIYSFKVFKFD